MDAVTGGRHRVQRFCHLPAIHNSKKIVCELKLKKLSTVIHRLFERGLEILKFVLQNRAPLKQSVRVFFIQNSILLQN